VTETIVVLPGRGAVPAGVPVLRADDRGVLHGDGVFETLHVRGGRPWLLDAHLDRMVRGAAALDLALPARDTLAALAAEACTTWSEAARSEPEAASSGAGAASSEPGAALSGAGAVLSGASTARPAGVEAMLRLVATRGPAGGDPTVFATVSPVDARVRAERRTGVRVATACLGVTATGRADAPWLLAGVKSLSYATNQAARRWAAANGADDVLWTSVEGYALESPTANLVWLDGDVLCTVPAAPTGILAGVTAGWLLGEAAGLGWRAGERMVTGAGLLDAAGVWLTSSVRGLVEVRALDGVPVPPSPHTPRLRGLLGLRDDGNLEDLPFPRRGKSS
jgi:4-amino-4-deoxychorismate lyase